MKSELGLESIAKHITDSLIKELNRVGIMYRIFFRIKTENSIRKKIEVKKYRENGEKITDLIGIRITLYFHDDVDLMYNYLKNKSNFNHESIDDFSIEEFKPTRCNLTFDFKDDDNREVQLILDNDFDVIATTYEIQLRTVLSEGWHEVEHDLRYKCKEDWNGHNDLNRNLNGIFATLETSEFSMLQLFSELSHRHYKNDNIQGLIKAQFRNRLNGDLINQELENYINSDKEILKQFHRIPRVDLMNTLLDSKFALPLTINNFIYVCNHLFVKDKFVKTLAGEFINEELKLMFKASLSQVTAEL